MAGPFGFPNHGRFSRTDLTSKDGPADDLMVVAFFGDQQTPVPANDTATATGVGAVSLSASWSQSDTATSTGASAQIVIVPISNLVDAFDDGTVNTAGLWGSNYEDVDAPITESGGAIRIDLPNALASSNYSGLYSTYAYDLTGRSIQIEVSSIPDVTNTEAYLYLNADNQGTDRFGIQVAQNSGTKLRARKRVSGTSTTIGSEVAYDATSHRWWQIRESAGTIYFDVGTNGLTWTNVASYATGDIPVTQLRVEVGAGASDAASSPPDFVVEGVNNPAITTVRPVSDVSDGTWTDQSGGASLYAAIDDETVDDTDYIKSSQTGTTDTEAKVRLGPMSAPGASSGYIVSYRYKKDAPGGDQVNMRVRLYDSDGTTVIATAQHTNIGTSWSGSGFSLTPSETATITGYATGLVLGFLRN